MLLEDYFDFLSPDDIRIKGHRIGIDNVLEPFLEAKNKRTKIREWLNKNVGCTSKQYWCEIQHQFKGAGDTWREACAFSFEACDCGQTNIEVDYVLHTPIDVDYGNPQSTNDVQNNIWKILEAVKRDEKSDKYPDLVIGDYQTPDNANGRIKRKIEEAVIEQLKHYITDPTEHIAIRKGITRPRSEFFLISKDLFKHVKNIWKQYPCDPMPIILDVADRDGYVIKVIKKVDLGTFYQKGSKYTTKNISDQISRTAYQISQYWLSSNGQDQNPNLTPADEDRVLKGMGIAYKHLREILFS